MKSLVESPEECSICVMDKSDPDIVFNEEGVCNHCIEAWPLLEKFKYKNNDLDELEVMVRRIKDRSLKEPCDYDCVLGVSGGADSSYCAYLAKQYDLKVLLIHLDNGWDTVESVQNIKTIVSKTGYDLETEVLDWREFRDIQRSFFLASVMDVDLPTDHAIKSTLYRVCKKHKCHTILSGVNRRTEHGVPRSWYWRKLDTRGIRSIHKAFGKLPMRTFPLMGEFTYRIKGVLGLNPDYECPLDNFNYDKKVAENRLRDDWGWTPPQGKHTESRITRFYQEQYLPMKFGIDKKRAHYSALIRIGELTQSEAIKKLEEEKRSPAEQEREFSYVAKKFGFSNEEFKAIIESPPRAHDFYASNEDYVKIIRKPYRYLKRTYPSLLN